MTTSLIGAGTAAWSIAGLAGWFAGRNQRGDRSALAFPQARWLPAASDGRL